MENVLIFFESGSVQIEEASAYLLSAIRSGTVRKVYEETEVKGYGKKFDGMRDEWEIKGEKWTFILPNTLTCQLELFGKRERKAIAEELEKKAKEREARKARSEKAKAKKASGTSAKAVKNKVKR